MKKRDKTKELQPHPVDETVKVSTSTTDGAKTYQELKDALFWCWDGFERAGMLFFLVHNTYKQVVANEPLSGDKVEIGVRKLEWVSGGKNILDVFISPYFVKEENGKAEYIYNGVPVIINVYEDSLSVTSPDRVVYDYEVFCVPNPYKDFEQVYG